MKLLVMSDSHRNIDNMLCAAEHTSPDAIIHLGDHISDAMKLRAQLPDTTFYMVMGNCDYGAFGENEYFLTLESVKILITHGHMYGVKSGDAALIERARNLGADIVLFGHTHRAVVRNEFGIWFMCPGQMERHDRFFTASYGIVTIEGNSFECGVEKLHTPLEASSFRLF